MASTAGFLGFAISMLAAIFAVVFLLILSAKEWKATREKARSRSLVDARMNARLLRLNL
jgi:hypothetical protein